MLKLINLLKLNRGNKINRSPKSLVVQEAINVYLELFRLKKQVATQENSVMARLAKNPISVKGLPRLTREDMMKNQ